VHNLRSSVNMYAAVPCNLHPALESWVVHYPEAFSFVNFTYFEKMLETCGSTSFPDFETNGMSFF